MQQAHLTAWQSEAPWPKRSQLEQDLRISRGVAAIFSDPVLAEHLAMRGGTVLHKGHLTPAARYSEDIDLVLVKTMDTGVLDKHLRDVLTPILGAPTDSLIANAWLALRNVAQPSKILRIAFKFVPLGLAREETIKVEVNLNEHASLYPLVDVPIRLLNDDGDICTTRVRSYDIDEMLGTKTRALMQRQQGRDLFDLCHAWQLSTQGASQYRVDGKRAITAFEWYLEREGTRIDLAAANAALEERLANRRFCGDMDTLLRPGLARFDAMAGAEVVRNAFFCHLSS